jgi:hypothetical protein
VVAHVLVLTKEAHGLEQEVVEIQGSRAGEVLPVALPLSRNDSGVSMRFLASEIRARTAEGCMVVSWTRRSRMADFTALS